MNADGAFTIGSTHAVCQDYVVAGNPRAASPYVILSDGCSSSPDTDIGARLLGKTAEQAFNNGGTNDVSALHAMSAARALGLAAALDLPPQAVDATLLTAHVHQYKLIVACSGDGVVILQDWSGGIEAYSISYPSGHPRYPAYTHQPDRLASLRSCLDVANLPALLDGRATAKEIQYFQSSPDHSHLLLESTFTSCESTEVFTFDSQSYQYAVLLSDGIHSFCTAEKSISSKSVRALSFNDVVTTLVSFKTNHGAFAARRLKRFLKDCQHYGWQHTDDLAMGAIYLGGSL